MLAMLGLGVPGLLWCLVTPPILSAAVNGPPAHRRNDPAASVYFGNGCFWHTQYDMFMAEADAAGPFGGRAHANVTALVGYAGGSRHSFGTACYHGVPGLDYSRLGHAEAVSVTLGLHGMDAAAQLASLAAVYFEHGFATTAAGRQRLDPADEGAEYRNVIGLPGGMDNGAWFAIVQAANVYGMPLLRGAPSGDTQGEYVVYVYDSLRFPFFRAEESHQFHENSVIKRPVPREYLVDLKGVQRRLGRLDHDHGCLDPPMGFVGIVITGVFGLVVGGGGGLLCALLEPWVRAARRPKHSVGPPGALEAA